MGWFKNGAAERTGWVAAARTVVDMGLHLGVLWWYETLAYVWRRKGKKVHSMSGHDGHEYSKNGGDHKSMTISRGWLAGVWEN